MVLVLGAARARAATAPGTEIVNVATCAGSSVPSAPPQTRDLEVSSNPAVTRVSGTDCIRSPVLGVSPAGTVAPGTRLTYTLAAVNTTGTSISGALFRMILDPSLGEPMRFTSGEAPAAKPSTRVPVLGSYDPASRALTWTVPSLGAGEEITLTLEAAVRGDVAAETIVSESAEARSAGCPGGVQSNTVGSPVVPPVLSLSMRADRAAAAPGDGIVYEVTIVHTGTAPDLREVELVDALPQGQRYVQGSARLDGARAGDPALGGPGRALGVRDPALGGAGRRLRMSDPAIGGTGGTLRVSDPDTGATGGALRFAIGPMLPRTAHVLQFAAIVGARSEPGEALNHAHAEATTGAGFWLGSSASSAAVSIVPGPFRQEAFLAGRVFVDDDGDGVPGAEEPGVPGALVLMEDGRGGVSDITGRWHIEGVRPGLHVLRVDPASLPPPLVPRAGGADWAGGPYSRFIEARASSLVVADMPIGPRHAARCLIAAGSARIVLPASALLDSEGRPARGADGYLQAAANLISDRGEARTVPGIACETGGGAAAAGAHELEERLRRALHQRMEDPPSAGGASPQGAAPASDPQNISDPLEEAVRSAQRIPSILSPSDGSRMVRSSINVEVVYPADATPDLRVNNRPVPQSLIGTSSVLPRRGIRAARYIGVHLDPGLNRITFAAAAAGNEPGTKPSAAGAVDSGASLPRPAAAQVETPPAAVVTVTLPGAPVELRVSAPGGRWRAGGATPPELVLEAVDGSGVRTTETLMATLWVEGAKPLSEDLDPRAEGFQTRIEEGMSAVRFAPLTSPGRVHVLARAETLEGEANIEVDPTAGPWRVTGLVEGHVAGEGGVEGDGGLAPGAVDEISSDGGRAALFARGGVGKASQLTVALDTAKNRDHDRLFQSFEPDLFYPVPGDTSAQSAQAESQSKLFARLDGPAGYAQYGDFATAVDRVELARYDRRMTGLSGRSRLGRFTLDGFAASTDQRTVRDVFAPDGTSGPYLLSARSVVARSETVIVEVRDRFRSDEVLARQVKQRDLDYSLDPLAGTLLFRGPVLPFDARLNPVRVVVLYESRSGGAEQLTAGGRFGFATAGFEAGASAVREDREGADLELLGADLTWRPVPGTMIQSEVARTSEGADSASAVRVGITSRAGPKFGWELSYRDIPAAFANPTYLGSPELGSRRAGGSLLWNPTEQWRIKGEAFSQTDQKTDLERRVAGVEAERRFGDVTVFGNFHSAWSQSPTLGQASASVVGAGVRGPLAGKLTGEIARQEALGSGAVPGYPTKTTAGLSYEVKAGTRAFLLHEIESGASPDRSRTILGVESQLSARTKALTRYTLEEGASGAALRATTGIETVLPVGPSSSVNFSASRLDTTHGDDRADFTTLTGGYEYRAGASLMAGRYEVLLGRQETRHMLTASGAFHPSDPWTLFVRERLSVTQPDGRGSASRLEGLLGAAFRPLAGPWQFLARLDHSLASSTPTTPGGIVPGAVLSEPSASAGAPAPSAAPSGIGFGAGREAGASGRDSLSLSVASGFRLASRQRLAATLIGRRVEADASAGLPSTLTHLLALHYTAEVHPRWTVGASLRRFSQRETDSTSLGEGVEVGYLVFKNLRLLGGYNIAGFASQDLPAAERTERGPFFSLQFKFDEHSLSHLSDLRLDRPD